MWLRLRFEMPNDEKITVLILVAGEGKPPELMYVTTARRTPVRNLVTAQTPTHLDEKPGNIGNQDNQRVSGEQPEKS